MKKKIITGVVVILTFLLASCASVRAAPGSPTISDNGTFGGAGISAQGALGRVEAVSQGPLYTSNNGQGIRLAVLAPEIRGTVPDYLPVYIQGLLNNNISRYSAINLIDRQNLDRIISEQDFAASGRFSDRDFVSIGNLTNTQYYLFGTVQSLSGGRYSLQLSITESATGQLRANSMKDGSLAEIERGALINQAAADLLTQMGVELTETGRRLLLEGNTSVARAEAGLARGITAQSGGDDVEALFNITQAITFDPSNLEALSRLGTLSSNISGGTISQRIVNDIQARNRWLEVFRETARFFDDHPPFEITFDPNLVQIGRIDYARNQATIGMHVALDPSDAGFAALNTLLEGLQKTGRREEWGFSGWPLLNIQPRTPDVVLFNGRTSFSFKVDVALLNENNKTLGNSSITLKTDLSRFSAGDTRVQPSAGTLGTVVFSNVRAEDLTPSLTIVIVAVNGIPSRDLSASGYIKVDTGEVERRIQEREGTALAAQAQREQEAAARQAESKQWWGNFFSSISGPASLSATVGIGINLTSDETTGSIMGPLGELPFESIGLRFELLGLNGSWVLNNIGTEDNGFELTIGPSIPLVTNLLRVYLGAGYRFAERSAFILEPGLSVHMGFGSMYFPLHISYRLRFGDYNKFSVNPAVGIGGYLFK